MEELLAAIAAKIRKGLPYLFDVQVLDDETLPPDVASYPCVGLMDGGTVHQSRASRSEKNILTLRVIVYQEIVDDKPGASIMGNTEQLGDKGEGVLAIAADLDALLNDEFLDLGFQYAHLDREDPAKGLLLDGGRKVAEKSLYFTYLKI